MPNKPLPQSDLDDILVRTRDLMKGLRSARLFLTGGTGFFGHWMLESLLHANRELRLELQATVLTRDAARFRRSAPHSAEDPVVTLLEGDVKTFSFPRESHTHIVHAATDSGGQQIQRPAFELAEAILSGTRRTLEFGLATGAARFLYTSTGAVYGRSSATETHIPETSNAAPDPLLLQSSYDEAKRMSEHLCVAYTQGTSLEAVIARPFSFVGPHLPLDQHFAIGNFLGAAMAGTPIRISGDGTPLRSWMYMADLTVWMWTLLLRGERNRAYNVGSEATFSIADAARLTAQTLHPDLAVEIAGSAREGAPMNSYVPSTQRARQELGLRETVDLAEALRRTAAWHRGERLTSRGVAADAVEDSQAIAADARKDARR